MSMLNHAVDTAKADRYIAMGLAVPGDLLLRNGNLVKVEKVTRKKYQYVDQQGRAWTCNHTGFKSAPADTVWEGPEKSDVALQQATSAEQAKSFGPGDIVVMANDRDRRKFPHRYVILKATSPTRFKLQRVGSHDVGDGLTVPANLIRLANEHDA